MWRMPMRWVFQCRSTVEVKENYRSIVNEEFLSCNAYLSIFVWVIISHKRNRTGIRTRAPSRLLHIIGQRKTIVQAFCDYRSDIIYYVHLAYDQRKRDNPYDDDGEMLKLCYIDSLCCCRERRSERDRGWWRFRACHFGPISQCVSQCSYF